MSWLISSALRIRFIIVAAALVLLTVGGGIVRDTRSTCFRSSRRRASRFRQKFPACLPTKSKRW